MTESEWLACADTKAMLRYLLGLRPDELRVQDIEAFPACRAGDRKLRLFACACYHRVRHLLPDPRAAAAVEVVERVAEGTLSAKELSSAEAAIRTPIDDLEGRWRASTGAERLAILPTHEALALGLVALWKEAQKAAYYASSNAHLARAALANPRAASSDVAYSASRAAEERVQADILRCIFGNPFRPASVDPSWLARNGGAVANVARAVYDDRAFDLLPVLSDALEDAGCDDAEILGHLRRSGPHARGCWVLDLLLGKE